VPPSSDLSQSNAESVYVGAGGELVALAMADGSRRWRVRLASGGDVGTPTVADGRVFAASGIGAGPEDSGVVAVDASSGDVRWTYKSPGGAVIYTPPICHGVAFVIGHDGLLVALDAATGEQRWSLDVHAELEALPAIVDDRVYVVGRGGPATAVDATTGRLLWEVPIEGAPFAPAVVGGYLIVGTDVGILYAIGGS
jgi:outer membrane protein assembly factor BamB